MGPLNPTERKRAEEALRRVNRALKTLSECNQALVRATEELEEISRNRDVLYDPEVVDACLTLFRDEGFQLEHA